MASDWWLAGVRVIDGTGADPIDDRYIHIVNGRIGDFTTPPAGAQVIDLRGAAVTPGLIDAHVHLGNALPVSGQFGHQFSVAEHAAAIFTIAGETLDAGYTTVRDTGGIDGGVARAVASGRVRGPRIIQCGPIQCQTGGHGHFAPQWEPTELWSSHHVPGLCALSLLSDGEDAVRRNVRETFRRGADYIKLCVSGGVVSTHDEITDTQFTVPEIAAAVHEATARGTYVTVHSHNVQAARNAIAAGVKCIEHGSGLDDATAALMCAEGVAHVPTFAVFDELVRDAESMGLDPQMGLRAERVRQAQIDGLRATRAAGVLVGLGSDLIGPDQSRRSSELRIRAELETPMDALVAATHTNARILRIDNEVGTITPGLRADLTVWREDPLDDPTRLTDARNAILVIKDGRLMKDMR